MNETLVQIHTWLEHVNPQLPVAVLMLVIWLPQYLIRRFLPNVWEIPATLPFDFFHVDRNSLLLLRKAWQALPSVALGALLQSLWMHGDAWTAVLGAAQGLLAPALHELMKGLPVPYQGGVPPAADPPGSKRT